MANETTGRRRKRERDFVMIQNSMFEDNRLSWKAKGLLGYLLTKTDGWTVRVSDLVKHATDGEKSIRAAIKELKTCGYLTFHRVKKEDGRWGGTVWEYDDIPMFEEDKLQKIQVQQQIEPCADFRHVENRHAENGTYISNTDFSNTDFNNISSSRESIDSELKAKYPHAPFEDVKEELINDETATINTDKQYKSMLDYRLKNWKPKQQRKKNKPIRTELEPNWLNETEEEKNARLAKNKKSQQANKEIDDMLKKLREG